ncbi:PREDICTED: uncharacterized protein LOC105143439 isoform X1 [Acromyrmex echinatior]|uniref:uncharacterized protein LOC105143439 isoform X1 n=1 Tax=Acromyrmex echinatior TaxID=103372 RepID=UPI000580E433|nr:PREDICTED: uncharacterized protein LOC105143439 isoform X1 [Acromyrmex echinatior]
MNTKRNPQHVSNLYNGGNPDTVGRDSPSALLEVLAEVASQTLHSEKKHINSMLTLQFKPKTASMKRKESCFTVSQLVSMPVSHLVKQFAVFTSDELKRQYSYTCALVPGCHEKYTSFASEEKARACIKIHLEKHLEQLKADKETYDTFTAKSINHKNLKTNLQNKKSRMQQIKKPQEMLNKENKDVILEKPTNCLRKIFLNDINIKENEKQKYFQKSENKEVCDTELKNISQIDSKVLGDHSYSERLGDATSNRKETSLGYVPDNASGEENIVLMVVGTDSVHMKQYSHVQKLAENSQDSNIVCLPDKTQISTEANTEICTTTKPKGKAKFIGTSKEEREMALAYIERIKKKGNPTGNNLQCRICDPPRSFTAPTTLVSHYRSHAGIKPYECRICKAVFTRRHSLKYHTLIHQNQTRFTCTDCGKKFRHPSHFREHQRRHTGEAPFGCDDCGQRFKTRNTYKRHLKTRHNKILTTFGEVLHPPEEEYQNVRINRKRKDDFPKTTINIDNIASNATVRFENHDEMQVTTNTTEEYVLKDDIDNNRNWETNDIIQIDKFENFEICSESQLNKTDGIETEIAIDCKYPDRENSNVNVECIDSIEDGLLQLKNPFYDNLRVTDNEENHVVCQHNIEDQDYKCSNEIKCKVNSKSKTSKEKIQKDEEVIEHEINTDFPEKQGKSNLQVLQETHDYHKKIFNSDVQDKNTTYLKIAQTEATISNENDQKYDEKYNVIIQNDVTNENPTKYANNIDIENKEYPGNNIFCAQVVYENINILQAFNEANEEIILENQNNVLQESECITQSVATDVVEILNVSSKESSEANQETNQRQSHQYLYVRSEQLSTLIAQNKYVTIPLHQIKLCRNHGLQAKVDNHRSIYIINEDIQTIIKQSEKQNTILILSSDICKNSIFQIDKNSIIVKALKR